MTITSRPNIVLITIDALRADVVDSFRGGLKRTPFLNSLAKKSFLFANTIVPATPTYYVFPALMTGSLPFKNGNFLGIPSDRTKSKPIKQEKKKIKTIAQVLKENNYKTYAFIADNPVLYRSYGYDKGFDFYFDQKQARFSLGEKLGGKIYKFWWDLSTLKPFVFFQSLKRVFFPPSIPLTAEKINTKALSFLKQQKSKEPFFLWLHYMDVHDPYFSGLNNFKFSNNKLKNLAAKREFFHNIKNVAKKGKIENKRVLKIIKEAYLASIQSIDGNLKDFIDVLRKTYPNSVFIITSDHGEAFMEHGHTSHWPVGLYNEIIKVPLLINFPDNKGKLIKPVVSLISLAKTIAVISKAKNNFSGENLLKIKTNSKDLNKVTATLFGCTNPMVKLSIFNNKKEIKGFKKIYSFTDKKWKFIYNDANRQKLLFNLEKDPQEQNNLAGINQAKADFYLTKIKRLFNF